MPILWLAHDNRWLVLPGERWTDFSCPNLCLDNCTIFLTVATLFEECHLNGVGMSAVYFWCPAHVSWKANLSYFRKFICGNSFCGISVPNVFLFVQKLLAFQGGGNWRVENELSGAGQGSLPFQNVNSREARKFESLQCPSVHRIRPYVRRGTILLPTLSFTCPVVGFFCFCCEETVTYAWEAQQWINVATFWALLTLGFRFSPPPKKNRIHSFVRSSCLLEPGFCGKYFKVRVSRGLEFCLWSLWLKFFSWSCCFDEVWTFCEWIVHKHVFYVSLLALCSDL